MSRASELASVLETIDSLAIVCHDNPDPDALELFVDEDDEAELLEFVGGRLTRRFFDALNLDD